MNAKLFEPRDLDTIQEVLKFAKNFTETWNAPDNKHIFFWTGLGDLIKERKFQFASDKSEMKWTNWSQGDSRENRQAHSRGSVTSDRKKEEDQATRQEEEIGS